MDSDDYESAREPDLSIADDIRALWNECMAKVRRGDSLESWNDINLCVAELRDRLDAREHMRVDKTKMTASREVGQTPCIRQAHTPLDKRSDQWTDLHARG